MSLFTTPYNLPIPTSALYPSVFNPYVISPLNQLNPLNPLNPFIPRYPNVVAYQDVNNDRNLKVQVVAYFYTKIVNNWLRYHYIDLYQMINVSGGKATLAKHISDSTSKNNSDQEIKCQYIIDNYLSRNDLLKILSKFRKMNGLNWWDLKSYSDKVRLYVYHKLKDAIKSDIHN